MRITLQPAFVLHHRPYRETSVLLDLLTKEYGRIAAVARGVRQARSRLRPLLQPFVPLVVSWQGKSELMTLLVAESNGYPSRLQGSCLLSGLYLNELLMRVLPKYDAHPALYTIYENTLVELHRSALPQTALRLFEKKLLEELGYGLPFQYDAANKQEIMVERYYRFHPEQGFEQCEKQPTRLDHSVIFSGKSLLAFAAEQLCDEESLRDAKRLMRLALAPLLGRSQLHSRKLYSGLHRVTDVEKPIVEVDKT